MLETSYIYYFFLHEPNTFYQQPLTMSNKRIVISKDVYHIKKDCTVEQLFDYLRVNIVDVFVTQTCDSFHASHGIHLDPALCQEVIDSIRSGRRYERIFDIGVVYEPEYKAMAEELAGLTEWLEIPVIQIF